MEGAGEVLRYTDLVLCDLKFGTDEEYRKYCGGSLNPVLAFLELTEQMQVPLWIRHVVVPGLTDSEASIAEIAKAAKPVRPTFKRSSFSPFKKLCVPKYEALGIPFPLEGYESCPDERIHKLNQVLKID